MKCEWCDQELICPICGTDEHIMGEGTGLGPAWHFWCGKCGFLVHSHGSNPAERMALLSGRTPEEELEDLGLEP